MDKLNQPTVRSAIEALQRGDQDAWKVLFTADAQLTDDGEPRDLLHFSQDAIGHEHFETIESVEDNGLRISGQFHSDQWGDFRAFFRFHLATDGRITRLEIGQAS